MSLTEQAAKYNNWTLEYCQQVIPEYERFIEIKANNSLTELTPSDDIKKMWQFHILNTEIYCNYCMSKFNKIIHHTLPTSVQPNNLTNLQSNKENYIKTINLYKSTFGEFLFKNVWNIQLNFSVDEVVANQPNPLTQPNQLNQQPQINSFFQPQLQQPPQINSFFQPQINSFFQPNNQTPTYQTPVYSQNKPPKNTINIYIHYLKQKNENMHDKQTINLSPSDTDTINELINLLVVNLKVKKEQIHIKPHNEISPYIYQSYLNIINKKLNESVLIKNLITVGCDFFIVEIN